MQPGDDDDAPPKASGFYANLAETLSDPVKDRIVQDLIRRIEDDKQARSKRDEQYEEGIRRTGLGKDAPGGAQFEGASKVVHPGMTEACIDYESRMIRELFPPSGPVKPRILGRVTPEKEERARRKTEHMNWQLTTQIKEARAVLETTLTQVPLGGSQFVHQWWDHRLKRPRWEFRSVDKMYWPFNSADFASAHRRTYADTISATEFAQRVAQGMYLDLNLPPPSMRDEESKSEKASRKVEGAEPSLENLDGDRPIYETMAVLEVSDDVAAELRVEKAGELCPYLITIDGTTRRMLAMYRDWEEDDPAREAIEHDFEFPFIPWRGGLSIGFPQIIGGLSAAATGALRALLDSAHASNAPGGLITKGSGASGQTVRPQVGEFSEIDGSLESDDIRKRVMPFSIGQPSAVLFSLLGFLTDAQRSTVRSSLDETPTQGGAPVPVGTQMSRVEEGLVVFTAIHGRGHAAMDRLLAGLHRLNRLYLPDEMKIDADGREIMVRRRDYEGSCDIQPVSEPTIYSDLQRFNQLNYIQSRAAMLPQLYKLRKVEIAGLKLMRWPDPESLLHDIPEPVEANAVTENLLMALGKPVEVFPEQDHRAHLETLFGFMKSPALGLNPIVAPIYLPAALRHAAQHVAYLYARTTVEAAEQAAGEPAAALESHDPRIKALMDNLLAAASAKAVPEIEALAQTMGPVVAQAMQVLQQIMPKPPLDPGQAAVQAAANETTRRGQADQMGHAVEIGKLQLEQQANSIAADRVAATREGQRLQAETRVQVGAADNSTALEIAEDRLASGGGARFTDGESMGKP